MRMRCIFILLVVAFYGCGDPSDDTSPAASSAQDDLVVNIWWPDKRTAIEMPFALVDDIPVIRCQLNGEPAVFYVDTASQAICLYDDRLARFGLKITSEKDDPRYTAAGLIESTRFCGEFTLTLQDGLSLMVSGAPCLPVQGRHPSHDVDGILSGKLMLTMNAVIDFGARKIIFTVKPASEKSDSTNVNQETNQTLSADS